MTYNDILLLIGTIAIFSQGFSFSRKSIKIMLASSIILILIPFVNIKLNGMEVYFDALLNEDKYDVIIAIVYVSFWWILGYLTGCFRIISKDEMGRVKMIITRNK